MVFEQPIDVVVEIIESLAESPKSLKDLTDKLWHELRSPVVTTPITTEAIEFLSRKKLVYKRRGVLRLTKEGRKIANRELPSPRHVSHYEQLLVAGKRRREEVTKAAAFEAELLEKRRQRRVRRVTATKKMGNIVHSI